MYILYHRAVYYCKFSHRRKLVYLFEAANNCEAPAHYSRAAHIVQSSNHDGLIILVGAAHVVYGMLIMSGLPTVLT